MVGGLIIKDLLKAFGLKAKVVLLALRRSYLNLLAVSSASSLAISTASSVFNKFKFEFSFTSFISPYGIDSPIENITSYSTDGLDSPKCSNPWKSY